MKKITLTFLMILLNISLYSQVITIFGGYKPFNNPNANYLIYFFDQSTETNSLYKNVYFNKKELYNTGISIASVDSKTSIYFGVYALAFFNQMYGGDFGLELGYVHPYFQKNKFAFFPSVGAGYGFHDLDIGDMNNTTGSIQINGKNFTDKTVKVNFRKDFIALRPSLNFYYELSKKISLQLTGSYLYTFNFKDGLHFYGSSSKQSQSIDLSSNNATLMVDGVRKNELPYSLKGFEVRVGIGFIVGNNSKEKIQKKERSSVSVQKPDSVKVEKIKTETDAYIIKLADAQKAYEDGKYIQVIELVRDFPPDHYKYGDAVILLNKASSKLATNSNQDFVTISGRVDCGCSKLITGYVVFEDINSRSIVGKCRITSDGYYFILLPSVKKYSYYIESKDFYPVSRIIDFTLSGQNLNYKDNITLVSYEEIKQKQLAVRINNIFFDFNKSELKSESFLELDRLFNYLNDNQEIKIELSGHTDNIGTDEYNMNLSQARANTVKDYLVNKGINVDRIVAKGYGKTRPVATNDTDEGRQLNRRVEFKIIN